MLAAYTRTRSRHTKVQTLLLLLLVAVLTLTPCVTASAKTTMATSGDGILRAKDAANASYGIQLQSFLGESGAAIKRKGTYDYGPSVIKVSNNMVRMWFCGGNTSSNTRGDSIWYSENSNYGQSGSWSTPIEVIRASNNWSYLDSSHACDPSVIRHGDNYYVFYTGAPDWRSTYGVTNACADANNAMGCDNRIFVARVPVWAPSSKLSYQKMVNVGECADPSCFQWQPFWAGTEYPPVPVVRYEDGPVWRIRGTGVTGYTERQTNQYGIGQPSALNINGNLVIWHTNQGQVNVWQKPIWNAEYGWNIMAKTDPWGQGRQFQQYMANIGNDVNYDVAFSASRYRYIATIARERDPNSSADKPCVHIARSQGIDVASLSAPIIDNNLGDQAECALYFAQRDAHNDGFLRDEYGYLADMPGHSGGPSYNWVYYGTADTNIVVYSDINRTPFILK